MLPLYWFGKRQRKPETPKRICAGTRRWGSVVLAGGTSVFARKERLTSAPSFRSQRKIVKSWGIVGSGWKNPGVARNEARLRRGCRERLSHRLFAADAVRPAIGAEAAGVRVSSRYGRGRGQVVGGHGHCAGRLRDRSATWRFRTRVSPSDSRGSRVVLSPRVDPAPGATSAGMRVASGAAVERRRAEAARVECRVAH